jgi:polyisoprenyl-teichoic acid--peptidoglycan teichoic acid transferase
MPKKTVLMKLNKTLLLFAGIMTVSFCMTLVIGTIIQSKASTQNKTAEKQSALAPTPTPTPDPLRPKNVLLLGYGGGKHDGGALTDTMILAHIRPHDELILLFSIPRDLTVQLPVNGDVTQQYKINAAYAIGIDSNNYPQKPERYTGPDGGKNMARDIVSSLTGQPIDAVIAVSFSGFLSAVNRLGPLPVTVPYTFTDSYYPIEGKEKEPCGRTEDDIRSLTATMSGFELEKQFPCRYETVTFTQGPQTMSAEKALQFVRSRHSDTGGGDFNRSKRQAALLTGIKQKAFSVDMLPKIFPLLQTIYSSIDTDISLTDIPELIQLYSSAKNYRIQGISLSLENILTEGIGAQGQYQLQVKPETTIARFIEQTIASQSARFASPTASTSASTSPSR